MSGDEGKMGGKRGREMGRVRNDVRGGTVEGAGWGI